MSVTSTCRFSLLLVVWLCHVTTALNASPGYYMKPFLQQTQYLRLNLNPKRTSSAYILPRHNTVVIHDKPVVDFQDHLLTREKPVSDNQGDIITSDEPVGGSEADLMTRNDPVILNQSQDFDEPSAQMQLKYGLNPCQQTKGLRVRGGNSDTFFEATGVQKSDSAIKRVSGGRSLPAGRRANDVPHCATTKPNQTVEDPSRCVWAIVSCCSPGSNKIRHTCFELLGCPGPFWDTNPCNKGMTASAVKVVEQFYSSGKRE